MSRPNKNEKAQEIDEIFDFLVVAEKLKTVKRDNLKSNGKLESDADHSWMMALMAILFESKIKSKVDMGRVMKLIAVHDLAEAEAGDVPLYMQVDNSDVKKVKEEAELKAIKKISAVLPEDLGDEIYGLWEEYEKKKTPEARYVKALDKLEAGFQALMFDDIKYWGRYGDGRVYYDIVLKDKKKPHWEHEEELAAFGEKLKAVTCEKMTEAGMELAEYE